MAVGTFELPLMPAVRGLRLAATSAGVRYAGRQDLALIEIVEGSTVAGVFTRNAFAAEPVKICRQHLAAAASPRFLLINSGNANACTGEPGYAAAIKTCRALAELGAVAPERVWPFSTGVIGEVLPADRIVAALPAALDTLRADAWPEAARAIMTTDTRPKGLSKQLTLSTGETVVINGIAKGAGMIKPDMGTMLGYVGTDAAISQPLLEVLVRRAADKSFNRITIDGDTSTNDALVLIATAQAGNPQLTDADSLDARAFAEALVELCQGLAIEMVRDAEGATKCVRVAVENGAAVQECLDVAYAICHSPLIKTALFASDPNWGRIVAAIGYAGVVDLEVSRVNVWIDEVAIVENGGRAPSYTEAAGKAVFNLAEFTIRVDLGRGDCREVLWTSDLSHDYVKINAEYRS